MENILFRSEEPFGDGIRDIVEVIKYETFSLGNTDILDYVSDHYEAFDAELSRKMRDISAEIAVCGGTILSEKEKTELIQKVVNSLNAYWGVSLKYCLWLAEKETVIEFYEASPESVEAYEASDYVLVDIGYDGMLFGYEELPKPIEGYMECLSLLEQLVASGHIKKDPENEDNILVYKASGTLYPEGWCSESIKSVARELVNDKKGQENLTKQLEKAPTETAKFCSGYGYLYTSKQKADVCRKIKSKKQIAEESEILDEKDIFTLKEFFIIVDSGGINSCDGNGYFHDGNKETNISVWDNSLTWDDVKDYPYVCWYNK